MSPKRIDDYLYGNKNLSIEFLNSVTVFGEGTGAASASYLMASPLTEGKSNTCTANGNFIQKLSYYNKILFRFIFESDSQLRIEYSILGSATRERNGPKTDRTIGKTFRLLYHTKELDTYHRLFTECTS